MSEVPTDPTVLDTTVPSNFAYIDRMDLLRAVPRVCTVPKVRSELREGVDSHPFLQRALDHLGDSIPVVRLDESAVELVPELERRLDPGEAQALAVATAQRGAVATDDGPAREQARSRDIPVTGSIGVLVWAVENSRISEAAADRCLKRWIDETEYRAPSRELAEFM